MYIPRDRVFWSVSLGHMANDVFMAAGPVLLAFIGSVYFPISAVQIGIALSAREMLNGVSQPLAGWLSDKGNSRLLGAGGVAFTVSMLSVSMLLAMTGNFWLMIVPFALSALGSGAFHPVGTAYASDRAEENAATATAYFFLFGQLGLALGPALIGFLLGLTQTNGEGGSIFPVFIVALTAIPSILFMSMTIPNRVEVLTSSPTDTPAASNAPPRRIAFRALFLLAGIVLLRGVASHGSVAFLPTLFEQKGWSPAAYGGITSMFWFSSALAGVAFGYIADRFERRWTITGSLLLVIPFLWIMPTLDNWLAFVMVIAIGALAGGPHSVLVTMAQSLIPGRKGLASGISLGFMFAVGALATLFMGYLAGGIGNFAGFGLERTYQFVAGFALAGAFLAMLLPSDRKRPVTPVDAYDITLKAEGAD